MVAPTPDADYTIELHYKFRPASLTTTSGSETTWLSDNAPDALLYGTLVEAATFLKVPEEIGQYEQRFIAATAALKSLAKVMALVMNLDTIFLGDNIGIF